MDAVSLIGIDLGKHFSMCMDRTGKEGRYYARSAAASSGWYFLPISNVALWRWQPVPGAHHMARQLAAFGHEVRLISPQFVKPFVKANKNDFIDAEAICEAASRPSMGFATPKTEEKQILNARHRVSESLVRDRVKTSNQIHDLIWPSRNIPIWLLQSYN